MRPISLTIPVFALLMALPGAPPTARDAIQSPAAGVLLIAAPGMGDPRFARSVVLLVQHSDRGAMGLIVNKRSKVPASEALSELDPNAAERHSLFFGGPVEPGRIMYVHVGGAVEPDISVIDGVNWGADYDRLKDLVIQLQPDGLRIFFGYAGWGPGQLEFELSRGDWQLVQARVEHIFSDDPGVLWRLLHRAGRGLMAGSDRLRGRHRL